MSEADNRGKRGGDKLDQAATGSADPPVTSQLARSGSVGAAQQIHRSLKAWRQRDDDGLTIFRQSLIEAVREGSIVPSKTKATRAS